MLKSDGVHGNNCDQRPSRSRQRTSTSCTECRRRKQKCNQAKDRPCNNCARRYPPVICEYAGSSKSKLRETVVEIRETKPKIEGDDDPNTSTVETFSPYGTSNLLVDVPLHGAYSMRHANRASPVLGPVQATALYSGDSNFEVPIPDNPDLGAGSVHEEYKSHMDVRSPYFPYPEDCQNSYFGIMMSHIGTSPVEPLHSLPIEATRRNAELMQMFIERLSPYMSSIDGQSPVARFNEEWMPFMIQSPIIAYIGILTTSYFQAIARGIAVDQSVDAIATRVKIINLINEHLTTHSKGVNDEAIAAVMALAYNELIYADSKSVLAHMRGLREMLRTRGGVQSVSLSTLRKMLFRTDYQVACTLECDPFLDEEHEPQYIPIFVLYPIHLDSPLLQSRLRFIDSASDLQISPETANILDDMRFLTTSVISMVKDEFPSEQDKTKLLVTTTWIHKRLIAPVDSDLAGDFIYQSVRAVATAYSTAILSRTPLSQACTAYNLRQLWMNLWRVPLSRWKQTPGIFFWMVMCVTPFARDKQEGRFLKGMFAATTIAVGLVDWDIVTAMLRGFLAVQRWLRAGAKNIEGSGIQPAPPKDTPRRKSTSAL